MFKRLLPSALVCVMLFLTALPSLAQDCSPITRSQLKEMLKQLGYEVKDIVTTPGKEKYEVIHTKSGYTVPVGYEISASTNFVWLTVNLGNKPDEYSSKNSRLIRQNGIIQPCFFYTTEGGALMMGFPLENRGLTNTILRNKTDFITDKVVETSDLWKNN